MTETTLFLMDADALCGGTLYERAYSALSAARQEKANAFRRERDRRLSVAAGLLLAAAVRPLGIDAGREPVALSENGKPFFPARPDVSFNLSHAGHFALCAVGDGNLGCDVEEIAGAHDGIAERFFSQREAAHLREMPAGERTTWFYRVWTLRESVMKAAGTGLCASPEDTEIAFWDGVPRVLRAPDGKAYFCREWRDLPGYCVSLAADRDVSRAEMRRLLPEDCL